MKDWIPCRFFFFLAFVAVFFAGASQAWAAPAATTTTLTLSSGGNPVAAGGSVTAGSVVTLTAGVSSGSTQLTTGQVNFCDAAAAHCTDIHVLGTAQLTSAGKAVFRFRPGMGSHSYKAVFAGTPNGTTAYAGSVSSVNTLTVTGTFPTTTAIAASGSASNYSLTATVTGQVNASSIPAPSGTVSFLDSSNGNFSMGTANLGAGTPGLSFLNAPSPQDGNEMRSFAVGDFNGDGILDLAVEDPTWTTLTVLFGNGDGTFTPGPSTPATGPIAAVGDFNGDGILDVVVVPFQGGQATVLLGDGTGNFTAKSNGSADIPGGVPSGFAVGDMNGDGILDLVAISPDNLVPPAFFSGVTTLLGKGDGTFTAVYANSTYAQTGSYPGGIAVGDFNGDGILDLAVTNMNGGGVEVLLGDGRGNYAQSAYLITGARAIPFNVATGDFNGDGIPDLAVLNYLSATVTILLGKGDGTFTPIAASPQTGTNPSGIFVADFNGDGIPDLTVGNGDGTLIILLGNGDGTFTPAATPQTGAFPIGIPVGDLNGDGISDLAAVNSANNTITVLLTQLTQTATATVTGIAPLGSGTHHVEASFPGDSIFSESTSASTGLTAQQGTPTVKVTPSSASITTAQQLTVTIVVTPATGNPTATGTVTLTGGGYTSAATALIEGVAQINIPPGSLAIGADTLTASYSGDTNYVAASGAALPVTVTKTTPTVTVTPSSSNITIMQPLTVTVAVTGASGNPAPTGSVTLTGGGYTSAATALNSGSATISIPAGSLAIGADTLTASYSGDTNYVAATGAALPVTVAKVTPTVTVTPSASSITLLQQLTVTIAVTSATGNPTPTGAVTLTGGGYTSAATTLSGGTATINIPPGSLAIGADTLTASYSGDTNYVAASGTAQVTVTNPTFTISGTAVTVTAGATTGNISTITVTPSGGFTGSVALAAAVTSSPAGAVNPPTFSFSSTTPVSITGAAAGTASLTISTTQAAGCSVSSSTRRDVPWYSGGGAALACILLFGIPARRRSWRTMLGMLTLLAALTTGVMACGGGNKSGTCAAFRPATTAGTYAVTVTGTLGALTETGTVALTVQ